jgi:hypothetical protein
MDVVALEPMPMPPGVIMPVIVTMIDIGTVLVDMEYAAHTAPSASVAPFLGGIESNPLIG